MDLGIVIKFIVLSTELFLKWVMMRLLSSHMCVHYEEVSNAAFFLYLLR